MQVIMSPDNIEIMKYLSREIINTLAKKYKFDIDDAVSYLSVNTERADTIKEEIKTTQKTNIPLPFCGVINKTCCQGIRLNYGLYTQCTNSPSIYNKRFPVCNTCNKQVEKNSNEEPNYGFISDRLEKGDKFRDPKGKAPVNYANIMEKLKITREEAETAAKRLDLTIPDEQFIIKKATRGRPKKDTTADDTASEASSVEPKEQKKRGRPKKNKEVVDVDDIGSKLLEQLSEPITGVETSKQEILLDNTSDNEAIPSNISDNNDDANDQDDDDDDDDDASGIEVQPIKLNKKTELGYIEVECEEDADYLLASNNSIYRTKTWDLVGVWNAKTKKVEEVDSDDE
jgi:hypothetical protein